MLSCTADGHMVSQFGRYAHLVSASQTNHLYSTIVVHLEPLNIYSALVVYYTAASEHF